MNTPLYDALTAFADTSPLRMHMPGHKGKGLPGWERLPGVDFTELPPTGNLYEPGGAIGSAEELWAATFGMKECLFLTCGSTQGIHAALTLACPVGSTLLADRNCHRSVYHAMALLDLEPVYLMEKTPQAVEKLLENHPEIKIVCITSPDYYGRLYDVAGIAAVCHRFGAKLLVDGAHGAHLAFLGIDHYRSADLAVCSAHKTLPALGQAALLFSGGVYTGDDLRRAASIHGTSSPSYPIMASMDLARAWMESGEGQARYRETCDRVRKLRARFPCLNGENLDPGRLTLRVKDGFGVQRALQEKGIWPEMADSGHVVFILTGADDERDLDRLERALEELDLEEDRETYLLPPTPEIALRPREALFAGTEVMPLRRCAGRIAGEQIAPYPPGVPVVAPGEVISKKHLAYLEKIGYNMGKEVRILLASLS
ncbi:MAG: aminotransferase class I/II-fold pyridoxal phosphate-dependent enzyme [Oscillospiraceae bacterium]